MRSCCRFLQKNFVAPLDLVRRAAASTSLQGTSKPFSRLQEHFQRLVSSCVYGVSKPDLLCNNWYLLQVFQTCNKRSSVADRSEQMFSFLQFAGPAATASSEDRLQLMNLTGQALTAVLDSNGCMVVIPPGAKTPPLSPPSATHFTVSVAPDAHLAPLAQWLPVNGIQILPPQASSFDLSTSSLDAPAAAPAAALFRIVAFPSRKESAFVVVLCSGVQLRNSLHCAVDIAVTNTSGLNREVARSVECSLRLRSHSFRLAHADQDTNSCFLYWVSATCNGFNRLSWIVTFYS
jgi:hypothetical protein